MDQLARGRRGEMGFRRKLEAQTAQTKCTSHGVHKRDFWNIPKSVSFLSSLVRFPTCCVSVFPEVGWPGEGYVILFPLLAFFALYLKALGVPPLLSKAVSFPPSSFRLFVQFCLSEPACGDFLDMYIMMQHKGAACG